MRWYIGYRYGNTRITWRVLLYAWLNLMAVGAIVSIVSIIWRLITN